MKVCHITETLQGASGVATFVRELDTSFRAQGVDVSTITSFPNSSTHPLLHSPTLPLPHSSTPPLLHCDLIHIHGLWLKMYHQAAQWAKANGIPVVWSTHGMTAPWSMHHKWWKKLPAWLLYQKRDLKSAAAIHCTTELEVEWNKSLGFRNCFIAPLGTKEIVASRQSLVARSEKRLLFVGRIYPVKGLVNLIKAWAIVNSQLPTPHSQLPTLNSQLPPHWTLRIVGPDEAGHQSELESLVRDLKLGDSVEFAGPKFGDELSAEYDNCDCLVLPSFTENFGATVVDAMAHGKPCIASTFTPWRELQEYGCGWWVSNEPEKLARAIGEMMSLDDATHREMGAKGRRLVEEKYTWDAVAETMIAKYREVVSG